MTQGRPIRTPENHLETPRNQKGPARTPCSRQSHRPREKVSLYAEYKEPLYAAPPILQRMVDAGRLGRKSGAGFYQY
jgi:hypothetical protein